MYDIWNLDLYLYNNVLWDTRAQKMKNLIENKYVFFPRDNIPYHAGPTDDEIREILRIYRDVVYNTTLQTLRRYIQKDWEIMTFITEKLKYLCQQSNKQDKSTDLAIDGGHARYNTAYKSSYKIIRTSEGACDMIRLALSEPDIFMDEKTEDEFWMFMVQLCDTTDFRHFYLPEHRIVNKNEYFANLVHALYLGVVWNSTKSKYQSRFESLVIVLYHVYKMCLDKQADWMNEPEWKFDIKLVFSDEVTEKIRNVRRDDFHGKYLLDMIEYQTRNENKNK